MGANTEGAALARLSVHPIYLGCNILEERLGYLYGFYVSGNYDLGFLSFPYYPSLLLLAPRATITDSTILSQQLLFFLFLCHLQYLKTHLKLNMHHEILLYWELPDVCVFSKVKTSKGL